MNHQRQLPFLVTCLVLGRRNVMRAHMKRWMAGWLCLVLVACGGAGAGAPSTSLDITGTNYAFTPAQWSVPAGQEITAKFTNQGTLEHEWVVIKKGQAVTLPFSEDDEDKVFWEIEANLQQSTTSKFTAPSEAGEYQVVCGIPSHIEQGMKGPLMVK